MRLSEGGGEKGDGASMKTEMEVEMAMRANGDILVGEDLTPPLSPLSHALYDSFLHSHCSSCFSPLPPSPPSPQPQSDTILYCSVKCSSSDLSLHHSSAELLLLPLSSSLSSDTCELRAALRLLASDRPCTPPCRRIAGLSTNHDKLMSQGDVSERIRSGAKAMAAARRSMNGDEEQEEASTALEQAALCATITNAVEVQDVDGRALGIAIYGVNFSWINHSCSPNAFYRFQFCGSDSVDRLSGESRRLRIVPFGSKSEMENVRCDLGEAKQDYGPRIIIRSIKAIKEGDEVTVAYTDLLQPEATRQSELQSKYQFTCCCGRCSAEPMDYVDYALQDLHAGCGSCNAHNGNSSCYKDEATTRLSYSFDEVISEYMSEDDPKSCCEKLEELLIHGVLVEDLGTKTGFKFKQKFLLQPLHYLSLNAYITLASAYKIRSSETHAIQSQASAFDLEAFDLSRISVAYSLLLAGAVHQLFLSESSLIASAANFWTSTGESLLSLSRSSAWSELLKTGQPLSSISEPKSCRCSLLSKVQVPPVFSHALGADFGNITIDFTSCATDLAQKVWSFLACGCRYLQLVKDPINYGWLKIVVDR